MTTTTRAAFAACLFAGIAAALLLTTGITPRTAVAHATLTEDEAAGKTAIQHWPEAPRNLRIENVARPRKASKGVRVSWDAGHSHAGSTIFPHITGYRISLSPRPIRRSRPAALNNDPCVTAVSNIWDIPRGCVRYTVRLGGDSYSQIVTGLTPGTTYYVHVAAIARTGRGLIGIGKYMISYGTIAPPITTEALTTGPETPETETPTPPDPETPETETPGTVTTPGCIYEHHIIGIPGTTGGGYTGQILISSKMPNATARIRAFQADNGHPLDVLDTEGGAVESITLSPAHSVKTFKLEGAQGWHTAIIEHASARAMRSAAVALRVRSPDVGVSVVPVQGIEHCEPATSQ